MFVTFTLQTKIADKKTWMTSLMGAGFEVTELKEERVKLYIDQDLAGFVVKYNEKHGNHEYMEEGSVVIEGLMSADEIQWCRKSNPGALLLKSQQHAYFLDQQGGFFAKDSGVMGYEPDDEHYWCQYVLDKTVSELFVLHEIIACLKDLRLKAIFSEGSGKKRE